MSIRCFIAVELEEAITVELGRLQDRFRRELGPGVVGIKWVKPDRIHLTLKFLGDVEDGRIAEVCAAAGRAAAQVEPFDVEIGDCGCFPPRGAARVLWVGVTTGADRLESLQQSVQTELKRIDFPPEGRKFSAHLTLARVRQAAAGHRVRELVDNLSPVTLGGQGVSSVTVFQSELTRTGPIYTPLHHAPLAAGEG